MPSLLVAISALAFSVFTIAVSNNIVSTGLSFLGAVLAIVAITFAIKAMV